MPRMRGSRRFIPAWVVFLLIILALPLPGVAQEERPTPTPEQLEAFRNLPPEQQRAVMDTVLRRGNDAPQTDAPLQPAEGQLPNAAASIEPVVPRGPRRIEGAATIVLEVTAEETPDVARQALLVNRRDRIHAANPYRLDEEGRLILPLLPPMPLAGLTAEEAARRLNADPRLDGLEFEVSLLPVTPVGNEALKPFGYEIFKDTRAASFAPAADIPVPPDYAIGPGDNIVVQFFGKRTGNYSLVVSRDGRLNLPDFGPIQVAGLDFDDVRSRIEQRVSEEMIGVRASVSMGRLRSIRVFVLGDVARPGSYTVSGLSTVTHALFASGGVSEVGSMRRLELKRNGATLRRLDLYDLLLRGDTSNDVRLQSGDVVFVPPIGATVSVAGRVNRPAIYELQSESTIDDVVRLAGGLAADSDPRVTTLERIDSARERIVLNVDLSSEAGRILALRSGDVLSVPRVLDDLSRGVSLEGEVVRPGRFAWHDGMRLTDLLRGLEALKSGADQRYLLIRRERLPARRIEVLSADAVSAFERRGTEADPLLANRDRVIVFSMQQDRGAALKDVLDELRLQVRDNEPLGVVSIYGRVRAPGDYPLEPGMTASDLIRAGGGLDEAAYALVAELTRLQSVGGESRRTEVNELQLAGLLEGAAGTDVSLKAHDTLVIKETPEWSGQGLVRVLGEVRFPGQYPIRKGETLSSVVRRAGGLTEHAFTEGAVLTREEIQEQERKQLEALAARLQSDLALVALQGAQAVSDAQRQNPSEALAVGQSLLAQLRASKPVGRLVIDLEVALNGRSSDQDIQLRNGDSLTVPPLRQYVTVIGEAQNPTAHVWRAGLTREDYLELSGGATDKANEKRIYVVRADGSVVARENGSRWFARSERAEMRPGDTIVVPLDTQKMRPLPLWTAVTTIIYNLAVSVAAIGSL